MVLEANFWKLFTTSVVIGQSWSVPQSLVIELVNMNTIFAPKLIVKPLERDSKTTLSHQQPVMK